MAQLLSSRVVFHFLCMIIMLLNDGTICNVVFQPAFILASGPRISSFLVGNLSGISFSLSSVSSSNATGSIPSSSCRPISQTQWNLSNELVGKNAMLVRLSLNRSLQLCGNETSVPDCCLEPLCLQETLLVSACVDETPKASLIIQTQIYAQIVPNKPPSENKTVIPNQVFEPLGRCPCDVSPAECDIRCCCDQAHVNDHSPKPSPSFQALQMTAPVPPINYRQGDPVFTKDDQYFTIPQSSGLGQCAENAPVAFLENFESQCVSMLQSCPQPSDDLKVDIKDGWGGRNTV
ncbi:hypothetical protein cypCar_00026230 [Cyprinus carpio]|nr:hypothetical protein cypCar_00026230 [Cyprinus carpio]